MEHEFAKKFKNVKLNFYKNIDDGRIEELNMQMSQGKIDFLFKAENSLLIITGSYGYGIYGWGSNRNHLIDIFNYIKNDPSYFASKCLAHSEDAYQYVYPDDKVRKEIVEWLSENGINENRFNQVKKEDLYAIDPYGSWEKFDDFVNEIVHRFDYNNGFELKIDDFGLLDPDEFDDEMNKIIPDYKTQIEDMGLSVNPLLSTYIEAMKLGLRQAKKQGIAVIPSEFKEFRKGRKE